MSNAATVQESSGTASDAATVRTVYLRCRSIHSRGDLVKKFFFQYRQELGIEDWYEDGSEWRPENPVEVVEVKTSRKPYFLVEIRPTPAEEKTADWSRLGRVEAALLKLGERVTMYEGEALAISPATGTTVGATRKKLEERDAVRKREREEEKAKEKGPVGSPGNGAPILFVPRAVRRQRTS